MSKLNVSVSPHIHDKSSTSAIMRDVVIALLPALAASVAVFGYRAALVTAVCVASGRDGTAVAVGATQAISAPMLTTMSACRQRSAMDRRFVATGAYACPTRRMLRA